MGGWWRVRVVDRSVDKVRQKKENRSRNTCLVKRRERAFVKDL